MQRELINEKSAALYQIERLLVCRDQLSVELKKELVNNKLRLIGELIGKMVLPKVLEFEYMQRGQKRKTRMHQTG